MKSAKKKNWIYLYRRLKEFKILTTLIWKTKLSNFFRIYLELCISTTLMEDSEAFISRNKKIKIIQRITYRLFIYIGDLMTFIPKNKSQSNHTYLLYLLICHFNYMKKLDLYRQTMSPLKHKARIYLKRFI